jgi:hypothetical protein
MLREEGDEEGEKLWIKFNPSEAGIGTVPENLVAIDFPIWLRYASRYDENPRSMGIAFGGYNDACQSHTPIPRG